MALSVIVHGGHRGPLLVRGGASGGDGGGGVRTGGSSLTSAPVRVALAVGVPLLLLDDLVVLVPDNLLEVRPQEAVLLLEAAAEDAAAE